MVSPEELFAEFMPGSSEIYSEYIEGIANRALQKYKLVIHERGSKEGEPLFTHVMSGIGVLTRLAAPEVMDLSDTELRVLLSAFTVHDINKINLFDGDKLPFNTLANLENVATALEDIEIGAFFPEWKDYLEDITMLVRAHSAQNNTVGEILIRTHDRTRLGREAVRRMIPLIRAADIADLSQSLEERVQKAKVLKRLHEVSTQQYAFATHRVAEQRGLLTNVLHRAVQDHLSERGAIPLLFYPDGVAYLVPRSGVSIDFEAIAEGFANSVAQKLSSGFRQFIHAEPSGILIEPQCLEQDMVEVWRVVYEMIAARPYAKKVDDLSAKIGGRLQRQAVKDVAAQTLLDEGIHLLPNDEAVLRLGELVRTYAIFLTEHFRGQFDPWSHLYELLGIQAEVSARWTPLDARYDRGYIVGRWLAEQGETLDTIWPKFVNDAKALCGSRETAGADPDLVAYARKNVCISLTDSPEPDWGAGLRSYIRNQYKQCSLCGSEFATQEWMAADVPNKQKVQQFSNRLSAGMTREPKRYVCAICRSQYLLDKLAYKTMDAGARCFVHFYPYSFFTPDYLESIRSLWRREKAQGVDSLMTNVSASWRESEEYPRIALVRKTVMGMPVPEFSEAVGNIFTVPINTPGDNATERFLHAIQTALLWKLWLGCRVALTEAPEPPFGDDWRGELFVDGVPASLRGLIPGNNLDAKEGQALVTRFRALRKLQSLVLDPKSRRDPLVLLARSLSLDALEPFWVMDRLILRKTDSGRPGSATFLRRDALPHLQTLVGKEDDLSHIKRLAEIAWESKLKGDSLKDTALAKPLDVAFAALGGYDKAIETPEDLRAVTKKDVQEAIERVTEEKYWGKTKIEGVSRFVDVLFDGLLKDTYHDDVSALLTNKRRIRAAFLHYIAAQIGTKEEG